MKITAKRVRREGINLDGRDKMARILQKRPFPPGVHGPTSRGRMTDYGKQLREKQRAKLVYGLMERQFRNTFEKAMRMKGDTGENLIRLLEMRLDNAVFRAGFAKTRAGARQLVSHAHIDVNGKKMTIPSALVKVGDVISIRPTKRDKSCWRLFADAHPKLEAPSWMTADLGALSATVTGAPAGEELKQVFDIKPIVEFYSR